MKRSEKLVHFSASVQFLIYVRNDLESPPFSKSHCIFGGLSGGRCVLVGRGSLLLWGNLCLVTLRNNSNLFLLWSWPKRTTTAGGLSGLMDRLLQALRITNKPNRSSLWMINTISELGVIDSLVVFKVDSIDFQTQTHRNGEFWNDW